MASYKMSLDVSEIVSSYRKAISDMEKAGAKSSITEGLGKQLDQLEQKFAELSASAKAGFVDSKGVASFTSQVQKAYGKLSSLGNKMNSTISSEGFLSEGETNKIRNNIKQIKTEISDLQKNMKNQLSSFGFSDRQIQSFEKASDKVAVLNARIAETRKKLLEAKSEASGTFNSVKGTADSKFLKAATKEFSGKAIDWNADYKAGGAKYQEGARGGTIVKELKAELVEATKLSTSFDELWSKIGTKISDLYTPEKTDSIKTRLQELYAVNQSAIESSKTSLESATTEFEAFNNATSPEKIKQFTQALDNQASKVNELADEENKLTDAQIKDKEEKRRLTDITNGLVNSTYASANASRQQSQELYNTAKTAEQASTDFDRLFDSLTRIFSIGTIFNAVKRTIRSTINDIRELDKAYASIAYVTNETVGELWSTYSEYAAMAEKLGQSTADVIQASAIYRQQGLDTEQALELTTDTMKLATIAGNDYATATQEMTAALRGFKMEMDEGGHVADVYSELAAHAAARVDDIAQAMSRTASIANSAGMSFENTSAFLTQMIETTQESAENIGTSMKTIIARFTELKKNVAGTEESEFDDLDFNKVDQALKSVGISLKDTQGQFRNLDEVFLELSGKWDTLDRNTQRYIATVAAGSRQQSRFIAMMDNYERTIELIDIAADSEGKADEQFAKAADTFEFKLNAIKTKWEELRISMMDSSFVKGLLDGVSKLMDGIKNIKLPRLAIGAAIAIPVAKQFVSTLITQIKAGIGGISNLGKTISDKIVGGIKGKGKIPFKIEIENLNKIAANLESERKNIQAKLDANPIKIKSEVNEQSYVRLDSALQKLANSGNITVESLNELKQSQEIDAESADILGQAMLQLNEKDEALVQKLRELIEQYKNLTQAQRNNEEQTRQNATTSQMTRSVMSGLSSGFSAVGSAATMMFSTMASGMGFMNGVNAASTMLQASLISMAINAIPKLVTAAKAGAVEVKNALASTGIGLLFVAAGIAITQIIKLINRQKELNKQRQIEYKIQKQTEIVKKAKENVDNAKEELKTSKEQLKTLEDKINRINELNNTQVKTTEEEEEYKILVDEIRDEFPSIIDSYNSITGQLTIQNEKAKEMLDIQREIVREQQKYYTASNFALANNQKRLKLLEQTKKLNKYDQITKTNISGETAVNSIAVKIKRLEDTNQLLNQDNNYEAIVKEAIKASKIDEKTFLQLGGYSENMTAEQWENLADEIVNDTDRIYKTIQKSADEITSSIKAETNKAEQYYEDMKIAALAQNIQENYENIEAPTAQALAEIGATQGVKNYINSAEIDSQKYMEAGGEGFANKFFDWGSFGLGTWGTLNSNPIPLIAKGIYDWWTEDDLKEWKDLSNEEQEIWQYIAKSKGSEDAAKFYSDIKDDEKKYQNYINDFQDYAESYYTQKYIGELADLIDKNPNIYKFLNNFGEETSSGKKSLQGLQEYYEEQTEARKGLKDENGNPLSDTTMQSVQNILDEQYYERQKELYAKIVKAQTLIGGEAATHWSEQQLDSLNTFIDNVSQKIGKENSNEFFKNLRDSFIDEFNKYGPDAMGQLFGQIDFTQANIANFEDFKKQSIGIIMELLKISEDEASKMFNDLTELAKKSGVYEPMLQSGDVNIINEQITERQQALEKNQDILEKIMNTDKPLKLTQAELKKLNTAIVELGKAGVNLDLRKYLNGDVLSAEDFNNALTNELLFNIENFDKTISYMIENGASQDLINFMKEVKENAISFNIGAKETLNSWEPVDRKLNDLATSIEKADNIMNQFIQDGIVNAQSLEIINNLIGDQANLYDYVDENLQLNIQGLKDFVHAQLKAADAALKNAESNKELNSELAYETLRLAALEKQLNNTEQEWTKQTSEDRKKAMEDYAKAQEDVIEKQKALNEAIEEYNKLLYGSDNRNSGLDLLYNYKEAISAFSDEMSRAQDILEDSSSVNDAINALQKYISAAHSRLAWLGAQSNVYDQGLNERRNNLLNNSTSYDDERTGKRTTIKFSDYVKYNANTGLMSINQSLIQNAKIADHWKDYIEKQVDDYNKLYQENLKNQDEIRKLEKEIQKRREDAIKKYADFEKDIAETLKSVYQEQVDNLKEKYDSMKEADDDYVNALQEAIEKQRKLRDRENKWEELAQKEKKLSLMSRDTSGANALETQKLEKEVQKDREQLLDESIDSVIENMQKLAEKQDELRQVEIELKEALLDNTAYWNQQAEQVASGFQTAEDYVEWFKNTAAGLNEQTAAQFEVTMNEAREKFNEASEAIAWNIMDDMELTGDSVEQTINVTAQEIKDIVNSTSTDFITAVKNTFETTKTEFNKNMDSAIEKVNSATKAYNEACEKAKELADEVNKQLGNGGYSGNGGNSNEEIPKKLDPVHSIEDAKKAASNSGPLGDSTGGSFGDSTEGPPKGLTGTGLDQWYKAHPNYKPDLEAKISSYINDIYQTLEDENTVGYRIFKEGTGLTNDEWNSLIDRIYKTFPEDQIVYNKSGLAQHIRIKNPKYKEKQNDLSTGVEWLDSLMGFSSGGMVNYTGPAWVDGSPQRPEAFLSAEDTERIGNAAKLLADIPSLNQSNISTTNASYGDTNVEINLNIDHISSDVDIDTMLERVKTEIVDIARPIGTNVILHQQV